MRKQRRWIKTMTAVMAAALLTGSPVTAYAGEERAGGTDVSAEELQKDTEKTAENMEYLVVGNKTIISDSQITGASYPGVSYDDASCTLTLENANIEATPDSSDAVWIDMGGDSTASFTLELIGENTISWPDSAELPDDDALNLLTISGTDKITFQGGGTLNLKATENMRNAIGINPYNGRRAQTEFTDCTVNIDARLDEDDWLLAVRGAGDVKLDSAELNITAEEGSGGYVVGIVNDYAEEEGQDGTIQTEDSRLHFLGTGGDYNYALFSIQSADFVNSDICLECPGDNSLPVFIRDRECSISIDNATTFQWRHMDDKEWNVGKVKFQIADDSYLYVRKNVNAPWKMAETTEEAFTVDDNEETSVWQSFMVSPDKQEGHTKGDIDGDTYITLADASMSLDHIGDVKQLTEEERAAADLNNDNEVTLEDLSLLLDIVGNN